MEFSKEYQEFYDLCLADLKSRPNYSDSFLPMLERYVLITMKAAAVGAEIAEEEVIVEHTNKAKQTNQASSPKLRMFILLSDKASDLARELKLSPISAPPVVKKSAKDDKSKGKFNLRVAS